MKLLLDEELVGKSRGNLLCPTSPSLRGRAGMDLEPRSLHLGLREGIALPIFLRNSPTL